MKYKIYSFLKKLKYAIRWFIFIFKQPAWIEYDSFIEIIIRRLEEMELEFRTKQITTSSLYEATMMSVIADKLKVVRDETLTKKVNDKYSHLFEGGFPDKEDNETKQWLSEYEDAEKRQNELVKEAFTLIADNLQSWWM